MKISRARLKDLPEIQYLLKDVGLPSEGVIEHLNHFLVLTVDGIIVGCVGLEIYKNSSLLRSLAVTPAEQGKGYGHLLVDELLRRIKKRKIKRVYLLTTGAADYFKKFNFQVILRKEADSDIQEALQFTSPCCQAAVCMMKTIE